MTGKVYLVGAGPGDPELLTQKAVRLLRSADVVLHDDLVTPEILALAPIWAETRSVGKRCGRKRITQEEIHALMIARSQAGKTVIRLKGGDPAVFSRAGEEIDALRAARVRFEIVPGVTTASAAAAAAAIALTDRRAASKLMFLTPHCGNGLSPGWLEAIPPHTTVVIYMPSWRYEEIAHNLMSAGVDRETPCLIVSQASRAQEQIVKTKLSELASAPRLPAPCVLIFGDVAANAVARVAAAPPFLAKSLGHNASASAPHPSTDGLYRPALLAGNEKNLQEKTNAANRDRRAAQPRRHRGRNSDFRGARRAAAPR